MKVGDLVVHVGASPMFYRVRMVCLIYVANAKSSFNNLIADVEKIVFSDGKEDLKSSWRTFHGWEEEQYDWYRRPDLL